MTGKVPEVHSESDSSYDDSDSSESPRGEIKKCPTMIGVEHLNSQDSSESPVLPSLIKLGNKNNNLSTKVEKAPSLEDEDLKPNARTKSCHMKLQSTKTIKPRANISLIRVDSSSSQDSFT